MGSQLQGYTQDNNVYDAAKKAAKMLDKSLSSFIGDAVEEKVNSMGLLGCGEKPNILDIINEAVGHGVTFDEIIKKIESMMEVEVCRE